MSKELLKKVFTTAKECNEWSLQIIKISNSDYYCREIEFKEPGRIKKFVDELADKYLSKNGIDSFDSVDDYTGDVVGHSIYRLNSDNTLISTEFNQLIYRMSDPDTEGDVETQKFQAYVISGTLNLNDRPIPVKFFTMQTPLVNLTNKFVFSDGKYKEIDSRVLSLRRTTDVMIVNQTVYMLTLAGERLFSMERAYKTVCNEKVNDVILSGILTNPEAFEKVAKSGHNPRRFVSYNPDRLVALSDAKTRKKLAEKFQIDLDENNKIDTSDEKVSERLVKFLCNKGMLDPLNALPVEVAAANSWS